VLAGNDWNAHHVQPRQWGGADDIDNLIALWCPGGFGPNGCHGRTHSYPARAVELGLLRRRAA
jgi:hypothetical protein